jgi:hypothetical protein
MYKVMKIIYDSALRDALLNDKKEVIENVLPALAAYEALLIIKGIFDVKEMEAKKEKEKLEREGGASKRDKQPVAEEQAVIIEQASPAKTITGASPTKKGQAQPQPEFKSEEQLRREAEAEEIKRYGVSYAT